MRTIPYLFLLLLFSSSCNFMGGRRVRGNGNLSSQSRSVPSFSGIRVVGSMDVMLNAGPEASVKVETDENLLKYILTEQDGEALVIKTRNGYNLQPRSGLKVYITAPFIETIKITGSGSVVSQSKLATNRKLAIAITGSGDVKLDVTAPQVEAESSGSGNIVLSGATKDFRAEISGSGEVRCFNLMSENTNIDISGSGSAEVFASKQLNVNISGSGDVAYKGTPAVRQRIAGSGDVRNVQ